jgi:hypothetical protein
MLPQLAYYLKKRKGVFSDRNRNLYMLTVGSYVKYMFATASAVVERQTSQATNSDS